MRGPDNSIIPRALGIEPNLEVDTRIILGAPDEVFLLCSDGLGNVLASQDILDILSNNYGEAPRDTCGRLIALAHERQARDKVSVVLVRCLD